MLGPFKSGTTAESQKWSILPRRVVSQATNQRCDQPLTSYSKRNPNNLSKLDLKEYHWVYLFEPFSIFAQEQLCQILHLHICGSL